MPFTDAVYDFRTEVVSDSSTVATAEGVTTGSLVLDKAVYNEDTDTISIISNNTADTPSFSSYNGTTRETAFSGLSANDTRLISISYDADALDESNAIDTFINNLDRIFIVLVFAFIPAALVAIFMGRT